MSNSETFVKEICDELCVHIKKNVCIDGDKNGFNSKMAVEKFKMFGVAIRNKTVTYDLLDEISKLCKSLRRDISERRKKHRQSVKRQKKMNTAKNANKLKQLKDKHG